MSASFEEHYVRGVLRLRVNDFTLKAVSPLLKSQRDAPQAFDCSVTERTDLSD